MKLSEYAVGDKIKLLVYGESGAGKTIFATTFPTPIKIFDFDGKISSAVNYWRGDTKLADMDADHLQPAGAGDKPFVRFNTELTKLEELAKKGDFPFKTVIFDSLTTYCESMLREVMRQHPETKRFDSHTPVLQDYGIMNSHFKVFLSRMLQLPCHVVFTAHIQSEKDESTGALVRQPLATGKLPMLVPMMFEEVYRMFTKTEGQDVKRLLQTNNAQGYVCRTQIKGLPPTVEANYNALMRYVTGEALGKPVQK